MKMKIILENLCGLQKKYGEVQKWNNYLSDDQNSLQTVCKPKLRTVHETLFAN